MQLFSLIFCVLILGVLCVDECPNAPVLPMDRRPNKSVLKIATYNGEWLFLNGRTCPGSGCPWANQTIAEQHLLKITEVLLRINADIVNIVEVNDCLVLKQMAVMLNSKGMNYVPYLLSGTDTATSQNVGLLTRVDPVVNLQRTANRVEYPMPGNMCGVSSSTGTTAVSKHYYTTFKVENMKKPLSIFGLHFLAFPVTPDRCRQREAQATVIRGLVAPLLDNGHSVVILGDFNDYDNQTLDRAQSVPTSRALDFLKDPIPSREGPELFNIASLIRDQSKRYSSWYDKNNNCKVTDDSLTTIDHILLSNDLLGNVRDAYYDHAYPGGCNIIESDHWPVVVELVLAESNRKSDDETEQGLFWVLCSLMLICLVIFGAFVMYRLHQHRQIHRQRLEAEGMEDVIPGYEEVTLQGERLL